MGSSKNGVRHLVQNNVAWGNKANGFYANHSAGGNTWYNNTSFQNGTQYDMLASTWDSAGNRTDGVTLTGTKVHIMRNNIGFPNKNVSMNGVDTQFNTWDLNITPAAKDFLSITDPTVGGTGQAIETTSPALGPRKADGSLPDVDFLKLAAGSAMIDKGTDVQLPFVGAAPDLGAYEYGATTSSGGGGSTGTGGAGGGSTGTSSAGSGGVSASGGATGKGGTTSAAGGVASSGGTPATGGTTVGATGGTVRSGGVLASGGVLGNGGTTSKNPATGGSTATETGGVASQTGGVMNETGGVTSQAGGTTSQAGGAISETGGATTVAPQTGGNAANGSGGAGAGQSSTAAPANSSGCSYAAGATSMGGCAGSLLAMLGILGLSLQRRRRR
jgi:hypothetical protein